MRKFPALILISTAITRHEIIALDRWCQSDIPARKIVKLPLKKILLLLLIGSSLVAEDGQKTAQALPQFETSTEDGKEVKQDKKTYQKQTVNKFIFSDQHLGISGYIDSHLSYSFNDLESNKQRPWNSNPEYMNTFGMSYGFISFEYVNENVRARIGFQGGEIVERMYIGERPTYKTFRDANAGYIFSKELSIEMGIFPSFYGAEGFVNKDNQHATRAIMTDFSPDYVSALRLNYDWGEHWDFKIEVTNGWQNIGNDRSKALGTLVVYEQSGSFLLNWGSYVGNEAEHGKPMALRNYHNFYAKLFWGKFTVLPMLDVFYEKRDAEGRTVWGFNAGMSVRYAISEKFGVAARYERLQDPHEIIPDLKANMPYGLPDPALPAANPGGFQANGYTLTFEFLPSKHMTIRLEGRYTDANNPIYVRGNNQPTSRDSFIYTSFAVGF